jgi:hypothetical protein
MYSRRAFIASGFALVTAGCSSPSVGESGGHQDRCEYEAVAEPFDPATDMPPGYSRYQQRLADQASRRGQATAYYGPRPLKRASYVEFDGSYYYVELVDIATVALPAFVLSVRWEPDRTPPPNSTVLSFPSLPQADQLALRSAVYGGLYRPHVHPRTVLDVSASPIPYPDGTGESMFTEGSQLWVRWGERVYDVTVHRTATLEKPVHEYTAERVAENAASFRALVADRYIISLDSLTPEERTILDEAVTGGYHEATRSPSRVWHRLLDRLRETAFPEAHYTWYVEYDEEWYTLLLSSDESCTS